MKKNLLSLAMLVFMGSTMNITAQVTGIKNIPGDYATLAAAITDLNTNGVGTGGAIINLNQAETAPAGGYVLNGTSLISSLSAVNALVINGNNNILTSYAGTRAGSSTSGQNDAIISLVGVDFVSIKKFNFTEATGNTTATTCMEAAVAIFNVGSTAGSANGCQNILIDSNIVNLKNLSTNGFAFAVYAYVYNLTTAASWTTNTADIHRSIMISNNTINECFSGIYYRGASTAQGRAFSTVNNKILNLGGSGSASAYGIYTFYLDSAMHHKNIIKMELAHGTGTYYGIFGSTNNGGYLEVVGNDIDLSSASTAQASGIYYNSYVGASRLIRRNKISGNFTATTTSASAIYPIYTTYGGGNAHTYTVDSNEISNFTFFRTSTFYGIYASNNATLTTSIIRNNTIKNIVRTGASGTSYIIYQPTALTSVISNNKIDSILHTNCTGAATIYGIYPTSTLPNVDSNIITNFLIDGTSTSTRTLTGIYASNSATTQNIRYNTIKNLKQLSTTGGGTTEGIYIFPASTGISNVDNNLITDISSNGPNTTATTVSGIRVGGGIANIDNNVISEISSPASINPIAVAGIFGTANTTYNIFHNTIVIGKSTPISSTGANFGAAGIYANIAATNTINNNLINISGTLSGTGYIAAVMTSAAGTIGTRPTNLNLKNNILFSNGYVYGEGNALATATNLHFSSTNGSSAATGTDDIDFNTPCGLFKSFMAGNASGSFSENNLIAGSTAGTWVPSGVSFAESGAIPTTPATTIDFSGATRSATPDIGALEFSGTFSDASGPLISYTNIPNVNCVIAPTLSTNITDVSGVNNGANKPRLYYKLHTEDNDTATLNNASSNGWKYVDATGTAPNFNFALDFSKLTTMPIIGDTIQYFVVAQDSASTPNVGKNNAVFPAGFCPTSVVLPLAAYPVTGFKSFSFNTAPDIMMSATPQTVCLNNNDTLVARLVVLGSGTVGSVSGTSTGTSPYNSTTTSGRRQAILYLASDLIAQGFQPGPITSIGWTVTSTTGFVNLPDFTIKMGHTNLSNPLPTTSIPATYGTGSSIVCVDYTAAGGYLPQTGLNMHTFTTPFMWDGVSNIIVETCLSATTTASSLSINYTASMSGYNQYNTAAGSNCTFIATTTTNTFRPVITMIGNKQNPNGLTYSWLQGTNPIGTNNFTQYVQPNFPGGKDTMIYKVQITEPLGCVHIDSIEVYKNTSLPTVTAHSFNTQTPCFGDSIKLNFNVTDGCPPYTISYKRSNTLGGATSPLTLSSNTNFFPTGDKGYVYADVVDNAGNQINNFLVDSFDLANEPIAIHDTLCGTGSLTLGATGLGTGSILWFDKADPKSAILLATSNTYTTPIISATDTFYAGEGSLNFYNVFPGNTPTNSAASTTVNTYGIKLRVKDAFKLDSVSMRFTAALTTACAATFVKYDSISATVANNFVNGYDTFVVNVAPSMVTAAGVFHFAPDRLIQFNSDKIGTTVNIRPIAHNCTNLNYYHYNAAGMYTTTDHISSAVDITGSTTTANYNVPNTYQYSYIYGIKGSKYCGSLLTPVYAVLTAPPALTLNNYTVQICNPTTNTASDTIKLTSPLSNYSSYTWSTGTGSIAGNSANGWLTTSAAASQDTFILTAVNATTGCQQIDTVFVNPVPFSTTNNISADLDVHCLSGASKIKLTGTPKIGVTFQWQKSLDNGTTWSNIVGSTFDTLQTGTILDTTQYRAVLSCNGSPIGGGISPSSVKEIVVNNPLIDSVKHDTICGVGSATLEAFANTSFVQWYSKSGTYLGAGSTYTTPILTATDTFIAKATTAPGAATSLYTTTTPNAAWGANNGTNGLMFNLTPNVNITIDSFLGQQTTAALNYQIFFKVGTYVGSETNAAAWTNVGGPLTGVYNTNNGGYLEMPVPGGLTLNAGQTYGVFIAYAGRYMTGTPTNNTYSNADLTFFGGASSPSAATFGTGIADRIFVGKIVYKTGCQSTGSQVIASVTSPPALTIFQIRDTVCSGQVSDKINITAPSSLGTYNTYTWNTPDVTGTSSSGYNFNQTIPGTYKYILEAEQTSGLLCRNQDTFDFTVLTLPTAITLNTPGPLNICNGTIEELNATSGFTATGDAGNGTISITSNLGNPYRTGAGTTNQRLQMIVSAAELTAASLQAGKITSLAFNATSVNTGTLNNYNIRLGHTTANTLPTTFLTQPTTLVYTAATFGPTSIGWNVHTFNQPGEFVWNGIDNVLIEICNSTVTGTTANVLGGPVTGIAAPVVHGLNATSVCNAITTGSTIANRPNIKFTQDAKFPITWSPTTSLFRNAIASLVYTGTNRDTVWARPNDTIQYLITATHSNGCKVYDSVKLNVKDSVQITAQAPLTTQLCAGQSFTLKPTFVSTSSMTYQWKKWNGSTYVNVTNAALDSFTIANAAVSDGGRYICEVSTGSPCSAKLTDTMLVNVYPGLTITKQPNSQGALTVCAGQPTNIVANASGQVSLQWKKIQGGSTTNYSTIDSNYIASTQLSDSGKYFVEYTLGGICGTAMSDTVTLNVVPSSFVSTDPLASIVCSGSATTFTAISKNSVSVSWMKGTSAVTAGGNISITNTVAGDSTVSSLTITNAALSDTGSYKFVSVTGGTGCANDTSAVATLQVVPAPTITTQPSGSTICLNSALNLSVTASNVSGYKWMRGVDSVGNASTYSITSAQLSDSGSYTVVVKGNGPCASITSNIAVVKVTPLAAITSQPTATTVCQGSAMSFITVASNADSIVWFRGTTRVGTGTTYSISSAASVDSGNYSAVAYSASGCTNATSNVVLGAVVPAPTITAQPSGSTICLNNALNLSVTASNASGFKWMRGVDSVGNTATYSVTNAQLSDSGNYTVVVKGNGPCASVTSTIANVTVTPLATITKPVLTLNPICAGSSTTVSANFTNADSVVWFQGTTRLGLGTVSGSTSTFTASTAGTYTARAYSANGCLNVDSTSAILAINAKPSIASTTLPAATICAGSTMSFAVTASNNSRVVWFGGASGTDSIQNATSFNLPATAGVYSVKVIGNSPCGDTTSASVTTTVTPLASITTQPAATTVCQGSAMSFTIAASNADSIVWFRGTTRVGTGTSYNVSSTTSADSANYSAVAYSAAGCTNATSNVVLGAVKPQATITTQPAANTYVLTGTNATVTMAASNFDSIVWFKGATRISNGATLSITNFDSATHAGKYTARVYSQSPCTDFVVSDTANIIKSTCPVITTQPIGDTLCIGSTYALSVTAGAVNTYEWYKVGNTTPIATTSSTTLNLNTLTSGGRYFVKLTPLTGCTTTVTSDTVNVGVDDSTKITAQPTASTTICEGSALNLSVTATGSGTLSYQWMNGATNVGTNSNSFSVSSAATSDAGTYNVMVSSTSACPSATSSNAVVNVTPAATITTQPSSSTICEGSTLSFTIAANNADSIVWFNGTTRVGTGTTFSQTNAQTTNSGNYVAIAYRGAGCSNVSSNSVAGTVNAAPAITTQPTSSAFGCNGSNFNSLSVVASNATSYQWKQGSTNKGGTSATISINPFTVSDTGNYTVVVSGTAPCADVTSTIANVKITDTAKIVTQPVSLTDVCVGGTLRLKVVGNGAASYQWYKGTTAISGETKDSLVIANVAAATAGTYKVEAIAFAGCVNTTSSNAVVTISTPVTFTTQPAATTICAGGTINLSTAVSGNSSPTYVWKKDGTALGAPSSTSFNKSSAMLSDSGNYTVEVTGSASCPTIVSNVAKVTINAAPTITAISGTSPLCVGSTLTLSATATNNNGVIWKKGTATVGTSSSYSKTAATSDAGSYTVTAVGKTGCADVTSAAFTQAITSPASITTQPVSTAVLTGSSFTLSVTASNVNTYQWYKGTTAISGATSSSYTVSSFDSATDAGSYTVEITSNSPCTGTITSSVATVTKTTCPVITSNPVGDTLCAGSSLTLSVTAVGANGYKWYLNGNAIAGATSSTYNVSNATPANSGTYRVEAIPFTGTTCGQIVSPDVKVLVESTPVITAQPKGNSICAPTAHTLRVTTSTTGHTYQWFKNGVAISGSTLDSLNVTTFTAVGDKYFVTMSGTGVCPSVSSDTVTVISRNPQTQVRLVTNSEQNLVEQCTENNWTYYAKAGVPNEFLLAIRKNGNNVMFAPDIEINPAGITTLQHTANNPNGAIFGRRFFNIDLISGTLQYPYDVKFYYAPADTLEVMTKLAQLKAANASVTASRPSSSWITSTLVPFTSSLLSGVTSAPVGFANTIVSANSNGKDNQVDYVEITNLVANNGGGTMFMDYTISSGSGISDKVNKGFGIEMYPVPATTELNVRLTSNTFKPVSFTITDMNGKVVMSSEERHQSNTSEHKFDISSFANGVYHIQLTNGETQSAAKFTVSK